ncbi:hypothetical protein BP5796_05120 [Coleophoma crateriformis]|uniref:Uncharacterized protein n=1 Tax=Coleophoma crateriformis TaxID=565419 RepID=A0A3D8S292_9HELO|nr:hypothetical protein BP5796_05120 [Coleophoma crateriformis]
MSRTRARIETITGLALLQRIYPTAPTQASPAPEPEEQHELQRALAKIHSHLVAGLVTPSTLEAAAQRLFPSTSSPSAASIPEFLEATLAALASAPSEHEEGETREEIKRQIGEIKTRCQEVMAREEAKEEEWKKQHPKEAEWEAELRALGQVLDGVFEVQTTSSASKSILAANEQPEQVSQEEEDIHWAAVEHASRSLLSLLRTYPIPTSIISKSNIEKSVHNVLDAFQRLDRHGVTRRWPGDWEAAERCWGVLDMVGSGLQFLRVLEKRVAGTGGEKPTTKSVFFLKSAPPAIFIFASSNQEWISRRLREIKASLLDIALHEGDPINRSDESRWNSVFRQLESLEQFLDEEGRSASAKTIRESGIDEVMRQLCERLEALHRESSPNEDQAQYALMHVSWELAMRIRSSFDAMKE